MNELSWLEINLSRLQQNLCWWRNLLALDSPHRRPAKLCAVVKANAYGLGAVPIAQRLAQAGVDMLAVYSVAQAEELIDALIRTPILVLMPTRELEHTEFIHQAAIEGRIHLAVNDSDQLHMVQVLGKTLGCRLPVHLHVDTGMSRSGLTASEFLYAIDQIPALSHVHLAGVMSHLATAHTDGSYDQTQVDRLDEALAQVGNRINQQVTVHVAATAGACRNPQYHRDMVRVGIGLYGLGTEMLSAGKASGAEASLQAVVRWIARIIHIQRYGKGTFVGYGCTHKLERDSVLGVVPVGYADGYPLSLSNRAVVRVVSSQVPHATARVLGRVSMDQIVIDLTDLPDAKVNGLVELISSDPASPCAMPKIAELADSSCYEMLCRLSPRLARKYVSVETTGLAATALTSAIPVPLAQSVIATR